ncbi:MAG: PqqD family peptide modification chaperone [Acidobacteria bacterium]|nr:PqqD family peptide modification chaperone [Acidobacteriota bacterium]
MQRLFSGFPDGWPGMSILFLRLAAGILLIHDGIADLLGPPRLMPVLCELLAVGAGVLLLAGLWTPVSGTLAAILELWLASSGTGDPRNAFLMAAMAAALTMLGPGAWSVDARLFGRRRIRIPDREGYLPSPRKGYSQASQSSGPIALPSRVVPLEEVGPECSLKQETEFMADQSRNSRIILNPEATASIHDDGLVILHVPSGRIFTSNQTGASVWQCLKQQLPLEAISAEISRDYEIDRATARGDVACFLTELERNGLIERVGEK